MADHPRSRGVYAVAGVGAGLLGGSSPLARGLRSQGLPGLLDRGIIPARAGFTRPTRRSSPSPGDHPRSRGVYTVTFLSLMLSMGSSPLARGLPPLNLLRSLLRRIIPARAGFTRIAGIPAGTRADHPRSRGVYQGSGFHAALPSGSSPLARGLRILIRPASPLTRDHPRSRGVYLLAHQSPLLVPGSSPLARGLLVKRCGLRHHIRIIPARAGFTRWARSYFRKAADHPRSRGVYSCG